MDSSEKEARSISELMQVTLATNSLRPRLSSKQRFEC